MMQIVRFSVVLLVCWGMVQIAAGQHGGSRAGVSGPDTIASLPPLSKDVAESLITIQGQAEVQIPPTGMRVVLAVTSEGPTASACAERVRTMIGNLIAAWAQVGIEDKQVVEDFIAVLPRYQWELKQQDGSDVAIESKAGYRMQSNLHLSVADESQLQGALEQAFDMGVTDIIAFDYWNDQLEEHMKQARIQAVAATREKVDALLDAVFDRRP